MKSHSYIFEITQCKFKECDCTGNNAWTVKIHSGMVLSKNIKCGLSDFETQDLENLYLQLKTYKIYECNECEYKKACEKQQGVYKYYSIPLTGIMMKKLLLKNVNFFNKNN